MAWCECEGVVVKTPTSLRLTAPLSENLLTNGPKRRWQLIINYNSQSVVKYKIKTCIF